MNQSAHVLVVEDNRLIAADLEQQLSRSGFKTSLTRDGYEAIQWLDATVPDIIVLDLMLPRASGWEVCRAVRASSRLKHVPVLMLTVRNTEEDVVQCLSLGADDYLVKPYRPKELVARVEALLRRTRQVTEETISAGNLTLEMAARRVLRSTPAGESHPVEVTRLEFDLLRALMSRRNQVLSPEYLWEEVWQFSGEADHSVIRMGISRLRRKLEDDGSPRYIATVRGCGFSFRS